MSVSREVDKLIRMTNADCARFNHKVRKGPREAEEYDEALEKLKRSLE
jgi:hypothetical protein